MSLTENKKEILVSTWKELSPEKREELVLLSSILSQDKVYSVLCYNKFLFALKILEPLSSEKLQSLLALSDTFTIEDSQLEEEWNRSSDRFSALPLEEAAIHLRNNYVERTLKSRFQFRPDLHSYSHFCLISSDIAVRRSCNLTSEIIIGNY
jgi:hypothetical protein